MPGIILDAGTETHFLHHLQVIFGAHFEPLSFEQFPILFEPGDPLAELLANGQQRRAQLLGGCDELFARINRDGGKRFDFVAGQRLEARDPVDFVAEKLDPQGVFAASGAKLDRITAHAKLAAGELDVVARVLQVHQPVKEMVASQLHGGANRDDHRLVIFLAANAINARHTGDDNHVLA